MKRYVILLIALFFMAAIATAGPPSSPPIGPNKDLTVKSVSAATQNLSQVDPPATTPTVAVNSSAGNLSGDYYYAVTYITADGETGPCVQSALVQPSNEQVDISAIPVSSDPRVTGRRIYRIPNGASDAVLKQLVATISDNLTTTYTDNVADGSLGVAIHWINTTGGYINKNDELIVVADPHTTLIGVDALPLGTGYANTAVGYAALKANITGKRNVAIGHEALTANTTGDTNVAVGVHGLAGNTTGANNMAVGYTALQRNTTGAENTAIGSSTMQYNTTASYNTAIGMASLQLSTGQENTAIGAKALAKCTSGQGNSAMGRYALPNATTANFNVAIGKNSLNTATTNGNNTAVGTQALFSAGGTGNIGIGFQAGYYETGSNRLYIDNTNRSNEAGGRSNALIYGILGAAPANQELHINAAVIDFGDLPTYADNAAAVTGGLSTGYLYQTSAGAIMIVTP